MHNYFTLVKVFITAVGMSPGQDKKRKIMIAVLGSVALFGVLLPVTIGCGMFINLMTKSLSETGNPYFAVQFLFHFISLFSVIFGLNVIFNEFYFSNDIEYLLPLPLRGFQIIASKFTAAFINENFMQIFLVIAAVIGYGSAAKIPFQNYILSAIGVLTLPIIPLIYCAIFSMIIMYFTRFIKNKDIVQKISVVCMFLFIVAILGSVGFIKDMDIEHYITTVANENHAFYNIMNMVFPHIPLFVKSFAQGNILALLQYLILNAFYIIVMLILAELTYFHGVIGLNSAKNRSGKQNLERLLKKTKQNSPSWAYFKKEFWVLTRTPPFFTNCVAVTFIWPLFVYAALKLQSYDLTIETLRTLYADSDFRIQLPMLLLVIGVSILMSAMNSLGSNAFSREGKNFSFIKYIPLHYFTQWNVKAAISIVISCSGILIYFVPFCIWIQVPILHTLFYCILCLMSVSFVTHLGLLIDSIQPKLIWDDELSALRENYNTFFSMALSILFIAIVCGGGYLFFCNTKIGLFPFAMLLVLMLAIANSVVLFITSKVGIQNIAEQEET